MNVLVVGKGKSGKAAFSLLKKQGVNVLFADEKIVNADNIRSFVRIAAIAYYIVQYTNYYNSGLDYGHSLATCHMNVSMGVFLLTFFISVKFFF